MVRTIIAALAILSFGACATQQSAPQPAPGYAVKIEDPSVWRDAGNGIEHIQTGITCPSEVGIFRLVGISVFPNSPKGDDVACGFAGPSGEAVTFYLTNVRSLPGSISEEQHFTSAMGNIKEVFPVVQSITLPLPSDSIPPTSLSGGFQTTLTSETQPGTPVDTALWLAQVGAWHVKTRATFPRTSTSNIMEFVSGLYSVSRLTLPGGTT